MSERQHLGQNVPSAARKCATKVRKARKWRAGQAHYRLSEVITTVRSARRVFFPLDRQLRLHDKHWSEGVAQKAIKYSAKLSYAEATEALQELAQIEISENSVWRLTQEWGEALKQVEEKEIEQANATIEPLLPGQERVKSDQRLGASMDGS